jgi:hypothetical protein
VVPLLDMPTHAAAASSLALSHATGALHYDKKVVKSIGDYDNNVEGGGAARQGKGVAAAFCA